MICAGRIFMRGIDRRTLRAAIIEVDRRIAGDAAVFLANAVGFRIHPFRIRLVEIDKSDISATLVDLRLDPCLACLRITLQRTFPHQIFGVPRVVTLNGGDDDQICTRSSRIGQVSLQIVRVALDAIVVVPILHIQIVAGLEKACGSVNSVGCR